MPRALHHTVTAAFLALAACAPSIQSVSFRSPPLPARPPNHPVRMYQNSRPECPFEEIGRLTARRRVRTTSVASIGEAMMAAAHRLGGDAIIGFALADEVRGAGVIVSPGGPLPGAAGYVDREPLLTGTVIRFTDPTCTR